MSNVRIERTEKPCGGKGYITKECLLEPGEKRGGVTTFSRITLAPHSKIGYHVHEGNGETYFILEGEALYNDNGVERMIKAGEATYTPNGCGHSMENLSDEPVVFMALIADE